MTAHALCGKALELSRQFSRAEAQYARAGNRVGVRVAATLIAGDEPRGLALLRQALERRDNNLPFALAEPQSRLDGHPWMEQAASALGIVRA